MKARLLVFLASISAIAGAGFADGPHWASQDQFGAFALVVASDAPASDRDAAELVQRYWEKVTGHRPEIVSGAHAGPAIWVGAAAVPEGAWPEGVDPTAFGGQEIYLKTLHEDGVPKLIVAGGPRNGTFYAALQFVEDGLGVRWLTPYVTHIPETSAFLPALEHRHGPVFEYRAAGCYGWDEDREAVNYFARVQRWLHGPSFRCHTFYNYVPPEVYFEDHPEYYSLVDGRRVAPTYDWRDHRNHRLNPGQQAQICMTHPEVLDIIYARIEADIAANPAETVHHISQMDWDNWCECDTCAEIDEREGTPMGSVLWGLNQLAERLVEDHPGHYIETLAYTYTRKAPEHLRPHENVVIKLCSIECDFSKPFDDPESPTNRLFAEDVYAWSEIAARLHVWDYLTSFHDFRVAMPNFHVIQPNFQFLAENKVKGIFPLTGYDQAAEFVPLRSYLISKLMWNPYADADAIMAEFIELYYREAAPFVVRYIEMLAQRQQADGGSMLSCFDTGDWYDFETVGKARALFEEAYEAVESEEIRERLETVELTVERAAFMCPPRITIADGRITIERPPSLDLDDYLALLRRHGMKTIMDYAPVEWWLEYIHYERPPRHAESALETIENDRYLMWIAPELHGSVLRWFDKKHDVEMLRGYERYGHAGGTWQDWVNTPGALELPPARVYEVVAKGDHSITLRAPLASGGAIERTLTLAPGSDEVEIALAFINETEEPLRADIKVHPEFFTQGVTPPDIWGKRDGQWVELTRNIRKELTAHGNIIDAAHYTRLAAWLPDGGIALHCRWDPDGVANLLYFYNVNERSQHVNLELLPGRDLVPPGERVVIRGAYGVSAKRPEQM